jgi:hypothetical protein
MLPYKLAKLKQELENELYLDNDDKKSLKVLKVLDSDQHFKKLISDDDILTKSFSVAPSICPNCGKPL